MSTFDKREEGFEKKFALDEEQKFKAEARRNKLLGLWAAEQLGKSGDEAAAYAKDVVAADFEEAGDADVLRKVATELERGVAKPQLADELAKAEFSNSQNANVQKWSAYISGAVNRQDYLERALEWVSKGKDNIGEYMSRHRYDTTITELKTYFNSVIDWVSSVFLDVESEMRGLEWGRLYETYHDRPYNPSLVSKEVQRLLADPYVTNRKGIFEYILGGCVDTKLLAVRVFDEPTKRIVYAAQTEKAKASGTSNCPLCALGQDANKARIWKLNEMDADHVAAWSKGGATDLRNCQMLCKTHNQVKGNR